MAGRSRNTPDHPSAAGGGEPGEGLLPADFDLADLYGARGSDDEDLDDSAVLVPPVSLPPDAELVAAALAVPLISYAVKLARWTQPHRPVDEFGDLADGDREAAARLLGLAPAEGEVAEEAVVEAMRAWALACDLDLVETGTTAKGEHAAIPGPDLDAVEQGDPSVVLGLWLDAAGIMRELAAEADSLAPEGDGDEEDADEDGLADVEQAREAAAELLDEALQVLYEMTAFADPGEETVPLGVLAALLVVPEGEEPDEEMLGEITDVMVALDPMLGDLAELGLLEHRPIDPELFEEEDAEEAGTAPAVAGGAEPDEAEAARFGTVRLTPLGQYAVREWLMELGYDAPLVGDLAEGDAETLLRGITESANVLPDRELAAWLSGREPVAAARELLAAARGQDPQSPVRRMLCGVALEELGEPARPAVLEVVDDPELGGAARAWLRAQGVEIAAPERPVALWTAVDSFAAVMLTSEGDAGRLRELVAGLPVTDNPASYFGELWRVEHPYTAQVLEIVGELHLDRAVAKEARKAAFRARSQQR
ncbi:hypothetical protein [Kitasatospora sp. MBT63]|uniref:hypothetical protein n=1 Tax=Kitasatospora sp. MBT63 TaxID=1444768 RepID=UPI0006895F0A|nr:hypothetical protein [Kitasatospora sp. MBT63]